MQFLKSIYNDIKLEKYLNYNTQFISIDKNLYDKIYDYFDVDKSPSKLSLFLQRKIENQKNREKLSCP